jgi:Protein of unknown function (DUF2510)
VLALAGLANSTDDLVYVVVLACTFAFIGYRSSHRFRSLVGVTPWRLPSVVWAVICFVLQPIGIVVELLAEFTTRPHDLAGPAVSQLAGAPTPTAVAERAASVTPTPAPLAEEAPALSPPVRTEALTPLFGWYPDVTGRHELRYWDGRRWSEHVKDADVRAIDPLED